MGISIWQLLIILAIVLVIFGARKLRNLGGDLGGAIKNFKQSMREGEEAEKGGEQKKIGEDSSKVVDAEVISKDKSKT
jgi:sec-independent protein translocase protein TatA